MPTEQLWPDFEIHRADLYYVANFAKTECADVVTRISQRAKLRTLLDSEPVTWTVRNVQTSDHSD